jgi:hypothetical protein
MGGIILKADWDVSSEVLSPLTASIMIVIREQDPTEPPPPKPKPTPLPKYQLFIICLAQFTEPLTGTVIYPFVNQFVRDTGVTGGDERKTGYYAGVIVSVSR